MTRFYRLLTLMVVCLALTACLGDTTPAAPDVLPNEYNYAAGELSFSVTLNGVVIQVNDVQVYAGDANVASGYVYVVPTVNVTNRSEEPVSALDFSLVDEYLNEYASWQTNVAFGDRLQAMPSTVGQGDTVTANHVFIVPASALQANLKVRWQSAVHLSRIDVSLGDLVAATAQ